MYFLEDVLSEAEPTPFTAPTISDEVAFWMYTSGSTGDPKAVKHVHTSLMASARLMGQGVIGIRADDVAFSAAKLSFSYGLGNAMSFPMSVGASAVLLPDRPTPQAVLATIRRHRPTIFYAVPSLYAALLAQPDIGPGAGSDRLRLCISAGEALPANLGERWRAVVGRRHSRRDRLDRDAANLPEQPARRRPLWLDRQARAGLRGEDRRRERARASDRRDRRARWCAGPTAGEGYWNQRAKSRRTFAGEWTYTGDKYVRDEDGYYHYCGRTDDMFKVNGMWVSPFEVEAALVSHEAVLEAAVIGKAGRRRAHQAQGVHRAQERLFRRRTAMEGLRMHVKERAGPWKYPRWIDIRPDLPRTATGKNSALQAARLIFWL